MIGQQIFLATIDKAKTDPPKSTGKEVMKLVPKPKPADKSKQSKYTRYSLDMENIRNASHALPYVYKFFWMIYRLSPVRTVIIISVFIIQGLLPALKLRTGGDFIRQVHLLKGASLIYSYKMEYSPGH